MIIEREILKDIRPYLDSPEAIIVTGMRRTGKTTLLNSIYGEITSPNKLFLDLENPLNQKYFGEEDYEKIKFNLEQKGLNFGEKAYVFLDEIQLVKNIPHIAKYFHDHYSVKFFMSGSSSFYMKNLFSESMAGRKFVFELFPLNFTEFLRMKGEKLVLPHGAKAISQTTFATFSGLYEEYITFGGFPGVVKKTSVQEKKKALEDIFSSYFQLEILQMSDFRKSTVVRDLILLLMQRAGSKLDIQKLSSELGVSRPTIYEYISFLEQTYFIKRIKQFGKGADIEVRGGEKVYLCDSGLLNNSARVSEGALFENNIFQLLRPHGTLHYYQKGNRGEIDFILNKKEAFEVKLFPSISEIKNLKKLSANLKLKKCSVISKKYFEHTDVTYGFML
ncbi:ATP-binding protein [Candidatus Peregrinibacteria bacterium]|nr:ATP-binding protein [Candidatus Peregrinibacteria bacterium]